MNEPTPYLYRRHAPRPQEDARVSFPTDAEAGPIHLQKYWLIIRKRLWVIFFVCCCTVLTALFALSITPPIYTARTTLLIESRVPQILHIQELLSEPLGSIDYDYYQTQFEILKNVTLAARVIREQGLAADGHLVGDEAGGFIGGVQALKTKAKTWVAQFFSVPPTEKLPAENSLGVNPSVIGSYLDKLQIEPVRKTRLVDVAFNATNPDLAARVANAHADAYIHQGLALRTRTSEEARQFLEDKLKELRARVEKSEVALNDYRRNKGMFSLDEKENIVVARLGDLNRLLTEAEAERITLEAQAFLIRKQNYDSLPAVINSTLIQTLKGQLAQLKGEYASLSRQFKPGFTRLDQMEAQVQEVQTRLDQEVRKVVRGIESAYLAAEGKEQKLRAKMEEQKAAALGLKDASVEYAMLAREVDTNRQLYDSVLGRRKEMEVAAGLQASNVFIISKAIPPLDPSKPRKTFSLLLSIVLGSVGGLGLAFFLEYFDNTLKTPEEVESYLHVPNLAVVPDFLSVTPRSSFLLSSPIALRLSAAAHSAKEPVSSFSLPPVIAEAYRTLRTAILFSQAEQPPHTILISSSTHGEGKTVTVLNTAVAFAQLGGRVLVIDADLRRPGFHRVLGVRRAPGLAEVLAGHRGISEAIQPTIIEHLSHLSSGSLPPNPAELLGSQRMKDVLGYLRKFYDYILIDSPPVIPVTDAVLLSAVVDGVILVVHSRTTPNYLAKEARLRLSYARAKILGVVLNGLDMRSGDYAYYYQSYCSYYSPGEAK